MDKKLSNLGAGQEFGPFARSDFLVDDAGYTGIGEPVSFRGNSVDEMVVEVPFMACTTLDQFIGATLRNLQNSREKIRHEMGMEDVCRHSMGNQGSLSIDSSIVILALAADQRWPSFDLRKRFGEIMPDGLGRIVQEDAYKDIIAVVVERVRDRISGTRSQKVRPGIVNACVYDVMQSDDRLQEIASRYSAEMKAFVGVTPQVERITGHVVRSEEDETIIVLEGPDRDELRSVPSNYFDAFGLSQEGSDFVMYRQSWTPDTKVETFVPAVRMRHNTKDEDRSLEKLEKRLPTL